MGEVLPAVTLALADTKLYPERYPSATKRCGGAPRLNMHGDK